jgi:hypothetical protein
MKMNANNIYDGCVLFKLAAVCECNVRIGLLFVHEYKTDNSAALATRFHADFLLALFFGPKNGDDIFLRNVC